MWISSKFFLNKKMRNQFCELLIEIEYETAVEYGRTAEHFNRTKSSLSIHPTCAAQMDWTLNKRSFVDWQSIHEYLNEIDSL